MTRIPAPFWALALSVVLHAGLALGLRDRVAHDSPLESGTDDPGAGLWVGQPEAPSPGGPGAAEPAPIPVEVAAAGPDDKPPNESKSQLEPREGIGEKPRNAPGRPATHPGGRAAAGQGGEGTGTAGSAAAARGLVRPLLRVLPPALAADPTWSTLPVGHTELLELRLLVEASGHVALEEPLSGGASERQRALVRRVMDLLSWPKYAVQSAEIAEGVETVRLRSSISEEEVSAETLASPGGAYGLGAEPPDGKRPGRAHCTWANGRRVDVVVEHISD